MITHHAMRPSLCVGADDAPPDADVLLTFGSGARMSAHGAMLAACSLYFRALLAWPTARGDGVDGNTAASGDTASGADRRPHPHPHPREGQLAPVTTPPLSASATMAAPAGRALRTVDLHDVDPDVALPALRALYGLPWSACWDELADVHELLDAWDAPGARARCLDMLLTSPVDRAVLSALAWETDPRPLSAELRRALLELAARQDRPFDDAAWERAPAAVAARFLARHDLNASEEQVLDAALRWVRASADRPAADVAAVSRAVRYGAVGAERLAALWTEERVPLAMLADAGRVSALARGRGHGGMPPVDGQVMMRCVPRSTHAVRTDKKPQVWRVACDQSEHWRCFRQIGVFPDLRQANGCWYSTMKEFRLYSALSTELDSSCKWTIIISIAERPFRVLCTALSQSWTSLSVPSSTGQTCNMVMPLGDHDSLRQIQDTDGLLLSVHVLHPTPLQ